MSVSLGAIYNLTGGQSGLDVPSSHGAEMAVAETNAAGGVLGRPVELHLVDGETDPAVLAERTAALLRDHPETSALFGLSDTDMVLAAAGAAAEVQRLFVTSGATSPRLPDQVPTYLYLACFGDNVQAAAAAEYAIAQMGASTALIIYRDEDTFTELLQGYFATRFTELGGTVTHSIPYTTLDQMVDDVEGLPTTDIVFFSAAPDDVIDGIQLLRSVGVTAPVLGGDSFDLGEAWEAHPEMAGVLFTTHAFVDPANSDPEMVAFIEAYEAAYPSHAPSAFAALGYDTTRLLLAAIEAAGSAEPDAVLAALPALPPFEGLTGTISYAPGSRIPTKSITLLAVQGGQVSLAGQVTPTSVPQP